MHDIKEFKKALQQNPPVECDLKVGDRVTFTNENGVSFEGYRVIGFEQDTSFYGRYIYLDKDSFWFPVRREELKKEVG